jgi:hypothetical protein
MKQLVALNPSGLTTYERMQSAIARCHKVDDFQKLATMAAGIAAYYKQIKDDESVRKFLQIKLRAWRRIGELLMASGVDRSKCETVAAYIRAIRAKIKDKAVDDLTDSQVRQALKIAELPADFFEENSDRCASIEALLMAFERLRNQEWEASPEGQAQLKRREMNWAEDRKRELADKAKAEEQEKRAAEKSEAVHRHLNQLAQASDEAMADVGITLQRLDREQMHQIVFLVKKPFHDVLRQAAFDKRVTMQSILRAGTMMWLLAHGYQVSE